MPVQEYNGPGVITKENLGDRRKLWQPPAITLVFPQTCVYPTSTPHPGLTETCKPVAQSDQIFSYREMEAGMQEKCLILRQRKRNFTDNIISLVRNAQYT
jgi:hypothetical protein